MTFTHVIYFQLFSTILYSFVTVIAIITTVMYFVMVSVNIADIELCFECHEEIGLVCEET